MRRFLKKHSEIPELLLAFYILAFSLPSGILFSHSHINDQGFHTHDGQFLSHLEIDFANPGKAPEKKSSSHIHLKKDYFHAVAFTVFIIVTGQFIRQRLRSQKSQVYSFYTLQLQPRGPPL